MDLMAFEEPVNPVGGERFSAKKIFGRLSRVQLIGLIAIAIFVIALSGYFAMKTFGVFGGVESVQSSSFTNHDPQSSYVEDFGSYEEGYTEEQPETDAGHEEGPSLDEILAWGDSSNDSGMGSSVYSQDLPEGNSYDESNDSDGTTTTTTTTDSAESASSEIEGAVEADLDDADSLRSQSTKIDCEDIEYVEDFCEGIAQVNLKDTDKTVIDKDGNIMFDVSEAGFSGVTNFSHGSALAVDEDGVRYLIDSEGSVLFDPNVEGLEKGEELHGEGSIAEVYIEALPAYRGYCIVFYLIDTYEYTGECCGIIDWKGNWLLDPIPLEGETDAFVESGEYHLGVSDRAIVLYRTGEMLESTGKITTAQGIIASAWSYTYDGKTPDEIEDAERLIAYNNMSQQSSLVYADADGNVVFDLSSNNPDNDFKGADINNELAFLYSDYVLAELSNEGGGDYVTIFDSSGNQMFEPLKNSSNCGEFTDVAFFYQAPDEELGYFLDVNGERLGEVSGKNGHEFYCDRAWIQVDGKWRLIDEKGKLVI